MLGPPLDGALRFDWEQFVSVVNNALRLPAMPIQEGALGLRFGARQVPWLRFAYLMSLGLRFCFDPVGGMTWAANVRSGSGRASRGRGFMATLTQCSVVSAVCGSSNGGTRVFTGHWRAVEDTFTGLD